MKKIILGLMALVSMTAIADSTLYVNKFVTRFAPLPASSLTFERPETLECLSYDFYNRSICTSGHKIRTVAVFDQKTLIQKITTFKTNFYREVINKYSASYLNSKPKYSNKIWREQMVSTEEREMEVYVKIPSITKKLICEGTLEMGGSMSCAGQSDDYPDAFSFGKYQSFPIKFNKTVTLTDINRFNSGHVGVTFDIGHTKEQAEVLKKMITESLTPQQFKLYRCAVETRRRPVPVEITYSPKNKETTLDVHGVKMKYTKTPSPLTVHFDYSRSGQVECYLK